MNKRVIGNPTTTPMAIPDWNQTNLLRADYIKNKPDFDGFAKKVDTNTTNIENLENRVFQTPITIIPTTLEPNKQYNFGEVTELALAFPTVANDGDVIYATFMTGETATALTIDTTNTCDIEFVPEPHTGYEVFGKFNGLIWIVNYSEYTVSEG